MKIPGLDALTSELEGRGDRMQETLDQVLVELKQTNELLQRIEKNGR